MTNDTLKTKSKATQQITCGQASCARVLFGQVKFCPFCGKSQGFEELEALLAESRQQASQRKANARVTEPARTAPLQAPAYREQADSEPTDAVTSVTKPETASTHSPHDTPSELRPEPPKRKKWGRYVVAGVAGLIVLKAFWPTQADPCETSLAAAEAAQRSGAIEAARGKALESLGACKGEALAKARATFENLDKSLQTSKRCDAAIANLDAAVAEGRLAVASVLVTKDLPGCMSPGDLDAKRNAIKEAKGKVDSLQGAVRSRVAEGDFAGARQALAEIVKIDRDFPQLAALSGMVDQAEKQASNPPPNVDASSTPINSPRPTLTVAPPSAPGVTAPSAAQDMVASLLRDGEAALSEKRFSDAKAIANSVLRTAPNAAARDLLLRASDAEARALRDETTLR